MGSFKGDRQKSSSRRCLTNRCVLTEMFGRRHGRFRFRFCLPYCLPYWNILGVTDGRVEKVKDEGGKS